MSDVYFVTGAMGCIGAWALYHLQRGGKRAVAFDLSEDRHRIDLLLTGAEQDAITFVRGDLTDGRQVLDAVTTYGVTHIVHLAALQVPFCRANPPLGAQVNVTGTVNIFEAARHGGIRQLAYASSIAVYGPPELYPPGLLAHDASFAPRTLYGVYKVANEQTAKVYWYDHGIASVALRPYTIYGLGRDQGLTSEPTKAMQAAARGEDYHIGFGGTMQFQYASDVAQQFLAAAEESPAGALAFNLGTHPVAVSDVALAIMAECPGVTVTCAETALPFPVGCDDSALRAHAAHVYETPLAEGVAATIAAFTRLYRP
jgi:nucleoside-diphosphate-sugar epimerase